MKILFLSDIHLPYTRLDLLKKAADFNKTYKADLVMSSGDIFDNYALSKYVKNPRGDTSHTEILRCIPQVKKIKEWFPQLEILPGNHCTRLQKRAMEAGISDVFLKDQLDVVGAPKDWKWTKKDSVVYDGVRYVHGFFGQSQKHCHYFNQPTVHGHLHADASIRYFNRDGKKLWNMSVGFLADKKAIAMTYGPVRFSTGIEAFGYITDGRPHLVVL